MKFLRCAAFAEAIPIIGPLLGAIPAVLVAATVSPELAVIVAGIYIVIQLIEGSVLVPLVMRNTIGLSPLLVLLSLLVGAAVGLLLDRRSKKRKQVGKGAKVAATVAGMAKAAKPRIEHVIEASRPHLEHAAEATREAAVTATEAARSRLAKAA